MGGRLRILDDCTFEVTGFTYDGNAPAAYWWGAPSVDNSDIRGSGRRIADLRVAQAFNGETVRCACAVPAGCAVHGASVLGLRSPVRPASLSFG